MFSRGLWVQVVPEETQILIERFLIGGFGLCLLVLIGCGIAIAAEAYFLSTEGKLPPDLDNFVVQVRQGIQGTCGAGAPSARVGCICVVSPLVEAPKDWESLPEPPFAFSAYPVSASAVR